MKQHDLAMRLLAKAAQDEVAIDRLMGDVAVPDEIVGFHCQQAAEKLLKAVLAEIGADVRRTHDLAYLADMLAAVGYPFPDSGPELTALNPFAVQFRYDLLDETSGVGLGGSTGAPRGTACLG
jgi:hypothetical protein